MAGIPLKLTDTQRQELKLARSKLRDALREALEQAEEAVETTSDLEPAALADVILALSGMAVNSAFSAHSKLLADGAKAITG